MKIKVFLCLLSLFLTSVLSAEPYLAIREGLKCSSCHINRTGGGERTQMGTGYGTQELPWKSINLKDMKVPHYWSFLDDRVSIGGDFRFRNLSTFEKGNQANTFQTEKANIYATLHLIPDLVSFYVDETVAPGGAQTREIMGLLDLPGRGWLKAGRFVLPYGIRLEDDKAFIREVTGFNFNNPDEGVEVGFEPKNWSVQLSLTNGTPGSLDNNISKQVVGNVAYVANAFRLGVSGSYNSGAGGKKNSAALWAGFRAGPAVLLGEADLVHDEIQFSRTREQIVTHAEIDYRITRGWNIKAAYEYFDPDRHISENQRDRIVLGVEPFLMPFVQLAIFYSWNQSIPQNLPQNADELNVRFHIFF